MDILHKRPLFTRVVVAFAATVMLVGSASAAIIGVEAESFDSEAGAGFDILSDNDAGEPLGGEYITTGGDNTNNSSPVDIAIYNFDVDAADAGGGYNLYMRVAVGPGKGGDDSIFVPDAMGSDPSSWNVINQFTHSNVEDVDGNTDISDMTFFWINLSDASKLQEGSAPTYTLASGPNTFELGGREDGFRVDAMVFSTDSNETSESLTAAVPVPEPSTFALLAGCFGLAWMMIRRRA